MNSDRAEMNDVIDFLNAWLDEDEALARATQTVVHVGWNSDPIYPDDVRWRIGDEGWLESGDGAVLAAGPDREGLGKAGPHLARHDAIRVLRDVAVIRQVIADYRASDGALVRGNYDDTDPGWRGIRAGRDAFKTVLMAYAKAAGWTPSTAG